MPKIIAAVLAAVLSVLAWLAPPADASTGQLGSCHVQTWQHRPFGHDRLRIPWCLHLPDHGPLVR